MLLSDAASERGVLAGIIQHGLDGYIDCSDLLNSQSFTIESNQYLFTCLNHIYKDSQPKTIDILTIISVANSLGFKSFFEKSLEKKHLKAIISTQVELSNVRDFAKRIKRLEIARKLLIKLEDSKSKISQIRGDESLSDIIGIAENNIYEISNSLTDNSNEPVTFGNGIEDYIKYLEENPTQSMGIPTGYPRYDQSIGGGVRTGVTLIGARAKVGKSSIADNTAIYVSKNLNIPVLLLDTEMEIEEHWNRMLAKLSRISKDEIETGQYVKDSRKKLLIKDAGSELKSLPYKYISVAGRDFKDILSIVRRWFMRNVGMGNNGLLIYDYFKLMNAKGISSSLQEHQVLGFQLTELNDLCIQYKLPCLSFLQLNRDGINEESSSVIGMSDRLSWFCTSFSIFKPKTPEELAEDGPNNGNRKMVQVMTRHGPGMSFGDYVSMNFRGDICDIQEVGAKSELNVQSEFKFEKPDEKLSL